MTPPADHFDRTSPFSRRHYGEHRGFEGVIGRFEAAWQDGHHPQIKEYLQEGNNALLLLVELVHADLEFRLRAAETARVEDYLLTFPSLAAVPEHVLQLAKTELY